MPTSRKRPGQAESEPGPRHWTRVTEVHTLTATRYQDGAYVLSYGRVQMGSRQLAVEALGEINHGPECDHPVECALAKAAEIKLIDAQERLTLW